MDTIIPLAGHVATGLLLTTGLFWESGLCMWFALIPWASVVGIGTMRTAIVGSLLAGTMLGLVGFEVILVHTAQWIKSIWIGGSIFFLGLSWMTSTLIARWLTRRRYPRLLSMLVAWFTFEISLRYLSALLIDGGIPLFQFGASQELDAIVQLASIGGLTVIGALIVLVNGLVWSVMAILIKGSGNEMRKRELRGVGMAVALVVLGIATLSIPRSRSTKVSPLRVGIVNIPLFSSHAKSALEQAAPEMDVVIFGEAACLVAQPNVIAMPKYSPGTQDSESGPTKVLWELSKHWDSPIVIGAGRSWSAESPYRFVSAVLVTPDSGVHQAYDKRWLIADIEYPPRVMRVMDRLLGRVSAIKAELGGPADPFELPGSEVRAGTSICYDVYFAEPFTQYMQHIEGPIDLAVNCAGHEQLSERADRLAVRHVRFRAIEMGRPIVHVAIAGTSCGFDAAGNELFRIPGVRFDQELPDFDQPPVFDIPLQSRNTLFSHTGIVVTDLWVMLLLIGSVALHARSSQPATR